MINCLAVKNNFFFILLLFLLLLPLFLFFYGVSTRFRAMDFRCHTFGTINPLWVEDVSDRLIPECGRDICLLSVPRPKPVRHGWFSITYDRVLVSFFLLLKK